MVSPTSEVWRFSASVSRASGRRVGVGGDGLRVEGCRVGHAKRSCRKDRRHDRDQRGRAPSASDSSVKRGGDQPATFVLCTCGWESTVAQAGFVRVLLDAWGTTCRPRRPLPENRAHQNCGLLRNGTGLVNWSATSPGAGAPAVPNLQVTALRP